MEDCQLVDLEFKGEAYTWHNKQLGKDNIQARLDKALANGEWRLEFEFAQALHEPFIGSNHRPIVVLIKPQLKKRKGWFKYEAKWEKERDWKETIERT